MFLTHRLPKEPTMPPTPKRRPATKALSRDEVQNRYHQAGLAELAMADAREVDDLTLELLEHIQAQPEGEFTVTVETTEDVEVKDDDNNTHEVEVEIQTERADHDWVDWLARLNELEGRLSQARAMRDARLAAARMNDLKRRLEGIR